MPRLLKYRVSPPLAPGPKGICLGLGEAELDVSTHVLLGRLGEQGQAPLVRWSFQKECVLGLFGKRGSGKSYTMGVFLEGLACSRASSDVGRNVGDRAVLVFDTLNIYQHSVVPVSEIADPALRNESEKDLRSFGLESHKLDFAVSFPAGTRQSFYPSSYEPFAIDTSLIRPEDYGHIFDIDVYRDPMGLLLLAAYDVAGEAREGSAEEPRRPEPSLNELAQSVAHDSGLEQSFSAESRRALIARLQSLRRMPLFTSEPTPIGELLQPGRVRVLLLNQLSPPLRSVVAALVTRQVFNARASAAEAHKLLRLQSRLEPEQKAEAERIVQESPPRTLICIDEAQGYAPPSKKNPCTEVLIQYVKEGRNHGLSLIFTSQQPSAIHPEVLSQMDGIVAHQLTVASDIDAALRNAKGRPPEKISSSRQVLTDAQLLRDLAPGQAWVSHGDAQRAFVIEIRPRVTAHGGIEG